MSPRSFTAARATYATNRDALDAAFVELHVVATDYWYEMLLEHLDRVQAGKTIDPTKRMQPAEREECYKILMGHISSANLRGIGKEQMREHDIGAAAQRALERLGQVSAWVPVTERLPECPSAKDELGTEVLIHPRAEHGYAQAFYGKRATGRPAFYLHGAEIHDVTHWMPVPKGPGA